MALLLGVVALSHLYPQAAFPGVAMLVATLLLVVLGGTLLALRDKPWPTSVPRVVAITGGLALAWPLWWLASLARAPLPHGGTETAGHLLQGFIVFAVATMVVARNARPAAGAPRLAARVLVVLMAGMALHALYQVHGGAGLPGTHARTLATLEEGMAMFSPDVEQGIRHALAEGRAMGRTGQPNVFAGLLALALPLALALLHPGESRGWRIGALLAAILLLLGIVSTGSRGGFLAMLAGLGVFLVLAAPSLLRRAAPAAAMLGVAILGMGAAGSGLAQRWLGGGTIRQRLYYWESGVEIWSRNWLMGAGPGGFEVFYPIARRAGAQETVFAHSWLVQWGTEVGAIGLALAGAWMIACLLLGLRWLGQSRREGSQPVLAAGFLAAAVVLLVHGLVEFTLQTVEPYLDLALVLGVLAGMGIAGAWGTGKTIPVPGPPARVLSLVLLLAMAWGMKSLVLDDSLARSHREEGDYLWGEALDPAAAAEAYTRALRLRPHDADLFEARAFARAAAGDPRGRDDLLRAMALNPHSARLRASAATFEAGAGNLAAAIEMQRQAIERHPLNVRHRVRLAELLLLAGRAEEARAEVTETLGMFAQEGERRQRDNLLREMGLPTPR